MVLAHEWEPYYKDEFRRAARLARELGIAIEPFFETKDPRMAPVNNRTDSTVEKEFTVDAVNQPDQYDSTIEELIDDATAL